MKQFSQKYYQGSWRKQVNCMFFLHWLVGCQFPIVSFEITKIAKQALVKSLTNLLNKYGLRKNIIVYVKDEGFNLNAIALECIINYESLSVKRKASKELVLCTLFQRCVFMVEQKKRFAKI
jgi:hypothetical protein